MAVVYPVTYMKVKNSRCRLVSCGLVWSLAIAYGTSVNLIIVLMTSSLTVIPYILTLPAIVFCDVAILRALRKPDPSGRSDVHPQKQRALQTITNSLIISVVSYLPPLVAYVLLSLIPLSPGEKMCIIIAPSMLSPVLGSTIMALCSLQNMGRLRGLRKFVCVLKPLEKTADQP